MRLVYWFICGWSGHAWKDAGTDWTGYVQQCQRCGDRQHLKYRR